MATRCHLSGLKAFVSVFTFSDTCDFCNRFSCFSYSKTSLCKLSHSADTNTVSPAADADKVARACPLLAVKLAPCGSLRRSVRLTVKFALEVGTVTREAVSFSL